MKMMKNIFMLQTEKNNKTKKVNIILLFKDAY
jgi:hypothetical protein